MTITLRTTILAATPDEADDLGAEAIIAPFVGGAYDLPTLRQFAAEVKRLARLTLIRASIVVAQIGKETGFFRYGNQVKADQYNFAGLGATNGGAAGLRFKDVVEGVGAVFAHQCNYLFGAFDRWPAGCRALQALAVRNAAVLDNIREFGTVVAVLGDYVNGRWAWSPNKPRGSLENGYAAGIATIANALLAAEGERRMATPQERTDAMIAALRADGFEVIDVRGKLPVNPDPRYRYGPVSGGLAGVRVVVQHWTGDSFGRATLRQVTGTDYGEDRIPETMSVDDEIDLLRWYANYHISKDGGTWGGIAYGALVFPSGRVYVAWNLGTLTYHAFSVNGYSYALCTPNSNNQPQTARQLAALNRLWVYLFEETPEIPAGWGDLWGHTECARFDGQNQTSCPGASLLAQVRRARAQGGPTVDLGKAPLPAPAPAAPAANPAALRLDVPGLGERWIIEPILSTWRAAGGVFDNPNAPGYPRTGMYAEGDTLIQWFDRARIEVKGEQVSFGLVGLEAAQAAGKAA